MRFKILVGLVSLLLLSSQALAQDLVYELPLSLVTADSRVDSFATTVTARLYAFSASEGDRISIAMNQDAVSNLDPYLLLFDSTGAVLASDDDSGAIEFAAALNDIEILEDGTYYVLATSKVFLDGTATSTLVSLAYEIVLTGNTPSDDSEILELTADVLAQGSRVIGESSLELPLGLYLYEGQAGDSISLSLSSAEFFTALQLFDPTGARLASDASVIQLNLPDDGVYLIIATDAFFFDVLERESFFTGGAFSLSLQNR